MSQYSGESSFLFGANETYIAEMYSKYLRDPGSVDAGWSDYFSQLEEEGESALEDLQGASWAPRETSVPSPQRSRIAVFSPKASTRVVLPLNR